MSGVPQGSVLGPSLFLIYINDLPDLLKNKSKLNADDNKVIAQLDKHTLNETLQDIDTLTTWSQDWLVKINFDKCCITHFGKDNSQHDYIMTDGDITKKLKKSNLEKDIGVLISTDLKWSEQVKAASSKVNTFNNKILGLLANTKIKQKLHGN